jgi:hypothetical protein
MLIPFFGHDLGTMLMRYLIEPVVLKVYPQRLLVSAYG